MFRYFGRTNELRCGRCRCNFQLYEIFAPQLKKKGRRFVLSYRNAINARFSKMEFAGISLDENWLIQESKDLETT